MTNAEFLDEYSIKEAEIEYYTKKIESALKDHCSDTRSFKGIQKNVEAWHKNKKKLIAILRNHPKWNEEAKSVILKDRYEVLQDISGATSKLSKLRMFMNRFAFPHIDLDCALRFIQNNLKPYVDKEMADRINEYDLPVRVAVGQKTTRVVNKLFKSYLTSDNCVCDMTTVKNETTSYEKLFAEFSDSLSTREVKRMAILSTNPVDYLLMSNGNSWSSCHNIHNGSWRAGCLSYMNDYNSMIFYSVNEDGNCDEDWCLIPKISRQVFVYDDGIMLQSRCYPSSAYAESKHNFDLIKDIFDTCLTHHEWREETEWVPKRDVNTHRNSRHYKDYEYYGNYNVSRFTPKDTNKKIKIGWRGYCLDCGELLKRTNRLSCCNDKLICGTCGQRHDRRDMTYIDGVYYCRKCCFYCDYHRRYEIGKCIVVDVYNVCEESRDIAIGKCQHCGKEVLTTKAEAIDGKPCCCDCFNEKYKRCVCCGEYAKTEELTNGFCKHCEDEYCDKDCNDEVFKYALVNLGGIVNIYILKTPIGFCNNESYTAQNGITIKFGWYNGWDRHTNEFTFGHMGRFARRVYDNDTVDMWLEALKEYQNYLYQEHKVEEMASCH